MTVIIILLLVIIIFLQLHINSKIPPRDYVKEAEEKYKKNKNDDV